MVITPKSLYKESRIATQTPLLGGHSLKSMPPKKNIQKVAHLCWKYLGPIEVSLRFLFGWHPDSIFNEDMKNTNIQELIHTICNSII